MAMFICTASDIDVENPNELRFKKKIPTFIKTQGVK